MKKTVCGIAVLSALMSANVLAHSEGDFIVRAGAATVSPNDSSGAVARHLKYLEFGQLIQILNLA